MKILSDKQELRKFLKTAFLEGKTIGFVPTMGALHEGHISLIERSKSQNDITVCSIFVNPTQFNDAKDFAAYPQPLLRDELALQKANCDILFLPGVRDLYPQGIDNLSVTITFGELENRLEGRFRPGHFTGVGLIVGKLFNIVQPNKAYFGQKDYQQYLIIKRLVEELDYEIEIEMVPTRRASDGLALSSRNERLSHDERKLAPLLYQALLLTKNSWVASKNIRDSVEAGLNFLKNYSEIEPQYLEIVNKNTLEPIANDYGEAVAICIAAKIGDIRLIDNLLIE